MMVIASGFLVGCGALQSQALTARIARVSGSVSIANPADGAQSPQRSWIALTGPERYRVETNPQGRFFVKVQPGSYRVSAKPTAGSESSLFDCSAVRVRARARKRVHVHILCTTSAG